MKNFGYRLKHLRLNADLTQHQLASQLGITKSVVSAYETGIRFPSFEVIAKMTKVFHVSSDYLLGLIDNKHLNEDYIDISGLNNQQKQTVLFIIDSFQYDQRK